MESVYRWEGSGRARHGAAGHHQDHARAGRRAVGPDPRAASLRDAGVRGAGDLRTAARRICGGLGSRRVETSSNPKLIQAPTIPRQLPRVQRRRIQLPRSTLREFSLGLRSWECLGSLELGTWDLTRISVESLPQVRNQILHILDPHRDPHQAVGEPDRLHAAPAGTEACVIEAGCEISVSTPPRLSASAIRRTRFSTRFAPLEASRRRTTACRRSRSSAACASSCCGCVGRPG